MSTNEPASIGDPMPMSPAAEGASFTVVPPPPSDPGAAPPVALQGPPLTFGNRSNDAAIKLADMRDYLLTITTGWPKVAGNLLCYPLLDPQTGRMKPAYIKDAADLISWIDDYADVYWSRAAGCHTKEELLRNLERKCDRYDWATDLPHWPLLPRVLYLNALPQPANTGRLEELVGMFDLHAAEDYTLVKAFVLTTFWGGPCGKRPLFVFATPEGTGDLDAGRGAGKSTIPQTVGRLAGGYFSLRKEADLDRVLSDLVSPSGLSARLVLMDNIKSLKFSSSFVEALITADQIDGHQLYHGHATRPNYVTYALTANEPMLSMDLATRCVTILVNQAKKSPAWDQQMQAMLEDTPFLNELHADILWHLQQPVKGAEGGTVGDQDYDRWSLWWREVVSRVCPDETALGQVLAVVKARRGQVNADLAEREQVEEALVATMAACGSGDPDGLAVFFPTRVLARILKDIFGKDSNPISVGRRLKNMQLPNFKYTQDGPGKQRGYWWVGPQSQFNTVRGIVKAFVEDSGSPRGYRMETAVNIPHIIEVLTFYPQKMEKVPGTAADDQGPAAPSQPDLESV